MKTKPFFSDGWRVAMVRLQDRGTLKIEVEETHLNARDAKRFSRWLIKASNEVAIYNHRLNWKRSKRLESIAVSSKPSNQMSFGFIIEGLDMKGSIDGNYGCEKKT